MRSATVATAIARPPASWVLVAASVFASRISSCGMSASPTVLYTVNPTDRVTPLIRASPAITAIGVAAEVNPSTATATVVPAVAASSTARNPNRLISGVVAGLIATLPANTNAVTAPDFTGDQPNWVWNISGSRNGTAPQTSQYAMTPACVPRNVGTPSVRRLSSGNAVRRRCRAAAVSSATDPVRSTAVSSAGGAGSATRCAPEVSPPRPRQVSTTPPQSSGGGAPLAALSGPSVTSRHAAQNAITPSGTLIRNIQCHDAYVVISPPASGAITGASSPGHTTYDVTRSRSSLAAREITIVRPTGTIIAPPAPCSTRIPTSMPRLTLAAQPIEARVNSAIAVRKITRLPSRRVSQPDSGISTASVSR